MLYIKKMSPWVDMKILFMSLLVSLRARWQAKDKKFRSPRKAAFHASSRAKVARSR
jgi:hypothetical protein